MITIDYLKIDGSTELESIAISAAETALENDPVDLTVAFCDNQYIQELNLQYRGIDSPTDVLSFPSDEINPESGNRYLGDIVVSYPQALSQAEAARNSFASEVSMLVVHGVLHLRGFDHDNSENKKIMWSKQTSILSSLGIKMDKFTGDE
jgi:probable rRNA maturation factor